MIASTLRKIVIGSVLAASIISCETSYEARDQALHREYLGATHTGKPAGTLLGELRYTGAHEERAIITRHEKNDARVEYRRGILNHIQAVDILATYRTELTTPTCTELRTDKESYDRFVSNQEVDVLVWQESRRFAARGYSFYFPSGCAITILKEPTSQRNRHDHE